MNLSRLFAPIALVSAIALSGISGSALADTTLRIGVTPVPHADIVNFIKPTLEKEGVKLEVVEFNDYIQPNLALDAGELDANYFQTIPYLEEMVKSRGLNLHILVSVHLEPMALYSKKVKRLADIPAGAKVAVPSDPTNEGRALKVLEHAGLIKLKDGATLLSGIGDIVSNPKKLKFVELEPALLPRALDDVRPPSSTPITRSKRASTRRRTPLRWRKRVRPSATSSRSAKATTRRRPSRSSRRRSPLLK